MALSKINTNSIADDAVTTAKVNPAQTDITSVGTLTSFASTGIDDNADALAITIDSSENVGIGMTTPSSQYVTRLVVGDGSGTEGITIYSGNDSMGRLEFSDATSGDGRYAGGIVYEHNNNALRFNTNGGNERMRIDENGHITSGTQPAFSAYLGGNQNDIAANNSFITVNFDTEIFDQNADFNTSTYTFTAPVTGRYQFNSSISLNNLDSSSNYAFISLVTSNRNYYNYIGANHMDQDDRVLLPICILADLDASDTALIKILINTGTAQADIATGGVVSNFQGYLVC